MPKLARLANRISWISPDMVEELHHACYEKRLDANQHEIHNAKVSEELMQKWLDDMLREAFSNG